MDPCVFLALSYLHHQHDDTNVHTAYPPDLPRSERAEDLSTLSESLDKSEAMFTMYLERSDEDDTKRTERWKRESDAILIFVSHSC